MAEENTTAVRNDDMDLEGLLHHSVRSEKPETQPVVEEKFQPVAEEEAVVKPTVNKDMIGMGMVVEQEEEEENEPLRSTYDSDERREAFAAELKDQEDLIEKAKRVIVIRKPENPAEEQCMIREISETQILEDGTIIIPENARFILPKTDEVMARIKEQEEREDGDEDGMSPEDVEKTIHKNVKERVVKILIDKTGFGANIEFDAEEKAAISTATQIHLVEVEDRNLQVTNVVRPDESVPLLQCISTYQLSVSKVPAVFPGSGFKAEMAGLSWGEFSDITFDISDENADDYMNFDKIHRRLSIIYNKMLNISIGRFTSFEEFLKKFAYIDIPYAVYGLLVATQPEKDTITLVCTDRNRCGKRFDYTYSPRGIIDFDTASMSLLKEIDKISDAAPNERVAVAENSKVRKFYRFQLPRCRYIIDLGLASCYDYLYDILSLLTEYNTMQENGEMREDDPRLELVQMLMGIRRIYIPQEKGGYVEVTKPSDIVDILNAAVPPDDVIVLNAAYEKYIDQNTIGFSLKNIRCPHCKHLVKRAEITPDELVFLVHQRQRATQIAFDNFRDF